MFRLILKDFFLLKKTVPFILGWLVFVAARILMDPSGKVGPVLAFIPILLAFVLVGNAIAMDEKYKLDGLYCSLPLKRVTIVHAKYFSTLILALSGIILSFLAGFMFPEHPLTFKAAFLVFFFFSMFFSILLPLNYRFGLHLEAEPGKVALSLILIAAVVGLVYVFCDAGILRIINSKYYILYFTPILAGSIFASIKLSEHFFKRREF